MAPGPGSSVIPALGRAFKKGLQLSSQAAKLRAWKTQPQLSQTLEQKQHTSPQSKRGNRNDLRENRSEKLQTAKPQKKCLKPKVVTASIPAGRVEIGFCMLDPVSD